MSMERKNFCSYLSPSKVSCTQKPTVRFRYPDYAEDWWSYRCGEHAELLTVIIEPLLCDNKFISADKKELTCLREKGHDGFHTSANEAIWGFKPYLAWIKTSELEAKYDGRTDLDPRALRSHIGYLYDQAKAVGVDLPKLSENHDFPE